MVKMVNFILYIFNPSKHIGQENILPNSILKLYSLFSFTTSNPTPAPTCSTCRLDSPKIRKLWTWSPGYGGRLHLPCSNCYYPLGPRKGRPKWEEKDEWEANSGSSCLFALELNELSRWPKRTVLWKALEDSSEITPHEKHMHSYTGPLLCCSLDAEGLLQWLPFDFLLSPLVPSSQSRGGH